MRQLVDALPERDLTYALQMLKRIHQLEQGPLGQALRAAFVDDEPTTPEEDEGAQEAWQELTQGEGRAGEGACEEIGGAP